MPDTIHTPASLEEADKRLTDIERVVMARGWERAAILATVIRLDTHGGDRKSAARSTRNPGLISAEQYAERGIPGLRDGDTIRTYVQRWLDAHDGQYPEPDTDLKLPARRWPPVNSNDAGSRVSSDPVKAVQQVIDKHGVEGVASGMMAAPPRTRDAIYDEVKLRRAGVDTSVANRKAAEASAHQLTQPFRKAAAAIGLTLCVQSLDEATEALEKALSEGVVTTDAMAAVEAAYERFGFTLATVKFSLS